MDKGSQLHHLQFWWNCTQVLSTHLNQVSKNFSSKYAKLSILEWPLSCWSSWESLHGCWRTNDFLAGYYFTNNTSGGLKPHISTKFCEYSKYYILNAHHQIHLVQFTHKVSEIFWLFNFLHIFHWLTKTVQDPGKDF